MTMDITTEVTHDNFLSRLQDQPLATVAAHYAGCLAGHEKAMRFTQDSLRLSADELAAQQVGFADRSLGTLIPPKTIKVGRAVREALIALGLYKHNGRETLRGRVTVPIRDQAGVVIGIRGHQVDRHASGPAVIVVGAELAVKAMHEAPTIDGSSVSQPEPITAHQPTPEDELILQDNQLLFHRDDRQWRIRGLEQNASTCTLKVALMVSRDTLVHVDSLDLVKAASRKAFIKAAASELFVDEAIIKRDVGRLAVSEGEGISQAAYALKLLQSEGVLRHATVGKGEQGRMTTHHYTVEGPVSLFLTTTALEVDEELGNRCLVLSVDESRGQTKAIHRQQLSGQTGGGHAQHRRVASIRQLHHHAQRLLEPLAVYNPYAEQLTFPSNKTRLRRDHLKYLSLIRTIALLHQHSRRIETDADGVRYVNVLPQDIVIAGELAAEILGRSLDELAPQTRTFLLQLHELVIESCQQQDLHRSEFRFTRRDVRQALGWSDWQTRTHLDKLLDLEYLVIHRGKNGQRFVYELLYDGRGREGQPFLMGLVDPAKLQPAVSHLPRLDQP